MYFQSDIDAFANMAFVSQSQGGFELGRKDGRRRRRTERYDQEREGKGRGEEENNKRGKIIKIGDQKNL